MNLSNPIYTDADAAREHLEALLWPNGPICPHCGVVGNAAALNGKSTRPGVYKCRDCRQPFSVTVGTVFERSKIPLNKWLMATHLLVSSKKAISSHQIHRMLGVTYKTAWFMTHRIREALAEFDFRYNNRAKLEINDAQRADIALKGIEGKRLTYAAS